MKPLVQAACAAALLIVCGQPVAAQTPPTPPAPAAPGADAGRISVEDCKQALAGKTAIFVDVRGEETFRTGHIAGAVSLPNGVDLKAKAEQFKQSGKTIITYCS